MTDYRLDSLSPRLFEHIVQELAIGTISTTVTPFGDGPDGGREATFEGETSYGAEEAHWNGYGIIQAKYKIRQQSVAVDGAWAIRQLQSELRQFTRARKRREAPDYYIFATNVVLAPNQGGTKDKLLNILRQFAEEKNLRGFDVWDYDKLRIFISRDDKVKRSYLAWISSSDVLAELCDYFESQKKDYYKIILRYLQNELLADQYAKLEQAGDSKDEAIPLSQVFIDLPTSDRLVSPESPSSNDVADRRRFVSQIVHAAGAELSFQGASALSGEVDLESKPRLGREPRPRFGRFVLIGGPGQGKTTVSQYICQIFRCEILQTVPQHLLSAEAQSALRNFLDQCNDNYRPTARRLPFRIVLSEFAKSLAQGKVQSLLGYLAIKLCSKSDITISATDVEKIIGQYPAIVILDGLDEVPSSTNRDELISAVSSFSIDVSTSNLDVLVVATSRPQGYNEEFSSRQYVHQYLVPLAPPDAMDYGSRLARIRFGSNEDRYEKVVARLKRALSKPATIRLMRTPLQVTILTLLVDRMGDPPDERWNLFKDYYQLIYERETERDIPSVAVLKSNHIEVDVIHRRVGIALQVESEKSGGTDARLTIDQFRKLVQDYLTEEGHEEPPLGRLTKQIIEAAANRLVFLVGLESGQVGFEIRSLQEFMAAEGITDAEDKYIYDRLRTIAPAPHWRNVYLFATGKCFAERRYMRPTIEGICNELNDDPDDESLRSLMVGSALALDLLEDGPARKAPLTRGGMTRLALKLLRTSFRDSTRLAGVCEEETRYIYAEDLRTRLIGSESPANLPAWECLIYLVDRYGGEFEELARELMDQRQLSESEVTVIIDAASGINAWLTAKLTEFVQRSPFALWPDRNLIDHEHDKYGPWRMATAPQWLRWYLQPSMRPERRGSQSVLHLSYANNTWNYDFRLLAASRDYDLMPPDDAPGGSKWNELRLLGRFCMNPSKESLATALRGVSSWNDLMYGPAAFMHRYPWPLVEALWASQGDDDGAVLSAVETGQYGDTDEWLATEQRYVEGSDVITVVSEDPIAMTEDGGLFRFPFRCLTGFEFRAAPTTSIDRMFDAFRNSDYVLVKDFLGRMLLTLALRTKGVPRGSWLDEVLCASMRRSNYVSPYFYQFIDDIDLNDPLWDALFTKLSPVALSVSYSQGAGVGFAKDPVAKLRRAYDLNRERSCLLVPLAHRLLDRFPDARSFGPMDIEVGPEAPPVVQTAAAVCKIISGISVSSISDDISRMCGGDTDVLGIMGRAVLRRGLDYRIERDELMTLWQISNQPRTNLEGALRSNFSRRPSSITVGSEWRRLNFPQSLYRLLNL